jgi:hypothetical protein
VRAHYQTKIVDSQGNVVAGAQVRLLQPSTTTPITVPIYPNAVTASTMSNPFTSLTGNISFYTEASLRVRIGITVGASNEVFVEDVDVLVPVADDINALGTRVTTNEGNIVTLQTSVTSLGNRVTVLENQPGGGGGGGSANLAQLGIVALDSFSGASDDIKMANAMSYIGAQTYKPTLVLANRTHTFANTYPLTISGLRISGPLGGMEREFSRQCVVHVTGTGLFSVDPAGGPSTGAKDFYIHGICFTGTGSNYFLTPTSDLSNGPILVDASFRDGGWVGFKTVMQSRHLRVSIERMYTNAGTDTQFYLAGSDNNYWLEGQSFLSAVNIPAASWYMRLAHMSRTTVGSVYITPQVCGGIKVEGSYGDLYFLRTRFDGTGRNTSTTWQQAPAINITGGAGVAMIGCIFFNTAVAGAGTKGIIQIQGGADHLVQGCTFLGGAAQTSNTPLTRPAVYTTATCKVSGLIAPNSGNKILQQSAANLLKNDDTSWTLNTAA